LERETMRNRMALAGAFAALLSWGRQLLDHQGGDVLVNPRLTSLGRIRRLVLVLVTTQLGLWPAAASTDSEPLDTSRIELRGCFLTGTTFSRDAASVVGTFVPESYTLGDWSGPGKASLIIWTFDCDAARVAAGPSRPNALTLVGIQVQQRPPSFYPERYMGYLCAGLRGDPDRPLGPHPLGNGLNLWDLYIDLALSNDADLVAQLEEWGFPSEPAGSELDPTGELGNLDRNPRTVTVDWLASPFSYTVSPVVPDTVHFHDNKLFHGNDPATASTIMLSIPRASDRLCAETPGCGTADAGADSWVADFLGATHRGDANATFDHQLLDRVVLSRS
jgi:hypothetical protein